jgi:hypothetical protein
MNIKYREVFITYLGHLYKLIEKAENSVLNESDFLNARLFADMLPLNVQAKVATNFALRGCYPISGKEYEELNADIETFKGLKLHITNTIDCINKLTQPTMKQLDLNVKDTAGFKEITISGSEYVYSFALPNFFFHISMVYGIAKSTGVSVTKGDFDGIHQYPKGFSWEA